MSLISAMNKAGTMKPFAGFVLSGLDDAANPAYFGYQALNGAWVIKRLNSTTGVMDYAAGDKDYQTNWGNRANIDYAAAYQP